MAVTVNAIMQAEPMHSAQEECWNSPEYYSCQERGMQVQKDIAEKRLESYPDVAADIINGTIYDGEQIVREGDLEQVERFMDENRERKHKTFFDEL